MDHSPNKPEPPPKSGKVDVWPLVIADMHERNAIGTAKYGTPLQTGNGRRPLVDLYQELLDATVYCRQEIEEEKKRSEESAINRAHEALLQAGVLGSRENLPDRITRLASIANDAVRGHTDYNELVMRAGRALDKVGAARTATCHGLVERIESLADSERIAKAVEVKVQEVIAKALETFRRHP